MSETRKRTNAEIDILNQFLKEGETPIPYEIDVIPAASSEIITLTPEQQKEQDAQILAENEQKELEAKEAAAKQKIIDDEAETKKNEILAKEKEKLTNPTNTPAPTFELDDEKVLAYLKEKKGKDVVSLDDILNPKLPLTEEEKKAAAEQRDANKIAFGLSKGLFTKKQLEEFITDTKDPQGLVLNLYVQEQQKNDPALKEEDIKADFEEKFSVNEDKESAKYKIGQNLLNNLADNQIRRKHSVILNLDNDFTSHETAQLQQKETEAKILKAAPLYKKDVEDVRGEIKKVSIAIDKDTTFDTVIDDEVVNDIISNMLDNKYSEHQIANGWNKETIKQVAQTSAIIKSLPKILREYGDAQVLAKQAGVRGILPTNERGGRQQEEELTDRQKQALNFAFPQEQAAAN